MIRAGLSDREVEVEVVVIRGLLLWTGSYFALLGLRASRTLISLHLAAFSFFELLTVTKLCGLIRI